MDIHPLDPTVDWSAIGFELSDPPVDANADASLLFSGSGSALTITGTGIVNTIVTTGTTVTGDANSASLTWSGSGSAVSVFDTGLMPGAAGFTLLAIIKSPSPSANAGLIVTQGSNTVGSTNNAYGFVDTNYTGICYATRTSPTAGNFSVYTGGAYPKDQWQVVVFDISAAGVITLYRGASGSFGEVLTATETAYYDPTTSFILGEYLAAGSALDIAQINLYKGTNRRTLLQLQAEYARLALWYNGNGTGVPYLSNSI